MSVLVTNLKEVREGLLGSIDRLRTVVARTTAVPLLVRFAIWVAGSAAMLVALPPSMLRSGLGLFLVGAAAMPAVAPRTPVVTAITLVPVFGWLLSTSGYGTPVTLWRLLALASLLYLVHDTAALAAQLPYDAIVSPGVLLRWSARVALVLAGTVFMGTYVLVAGELFGGPGTLVATVVGLAAAVGVAAVLARVVPRRPDDGR